MCKIMQHYEDVAREEGQVSILKNLLQSGMNFDTLMKSAKIDEKDWQKYRMLLQL